jgi:truncated hemoglobin YjbI
MSQTLYEFAGGRDAIVRLARAHYRRCLDDPVL